MEEIISWLKQNYDTDKIFTHIDTDTKDVWLNLDWGPDEKGNAHPGGPFFKGDKHYIIYVRDNFAKASMKPPEKSNKPPKLLSLNPDKISPQEIGIDITWTAEAKDLEDDQMQYRFFLNGEPVTKWLTDNKWTWKPTDFDIGENQIEVRVRDEKHSGPNGYDSNKVVSFDVAETKPKAPENQPPVLDSLMPDKVSPQEAGTTVTWAAEAKDPENDEIIYRFFLNNEPETKWIKENKWTWTTTDYNIGDNQIEVRVRDRMHAGDDGFDRNKVASFAVDEPETTEPNRAGPQESTHQDKAAHVCTGAELATESGSYASMTFCLPPEVVVEPEGIHEANYPSGSEVAASLLLDGSRVELHLLYPSRSPQMELAPADLKPYLEAYDPAFAQASYSESVINAVLVGQLGNLKFKANQRNQTLLLVTVDANLNDATWGAFLENLTIFINEDMDPASHIYEEEEVAADKEAMIADMEAAQAKMHELRQMARR